MGTNLKKLILLIVVLLLTSCEIASTKVQDGIDQETKNALNILEKKGFDTKNYQVLELPYGKDGNLEKMISIEGDCLFLIKDLEKSLRSKQYHTNNILKKSIAGNLRIALKTSGANAMSAEWKNAFKIAIANWNSLQTKLKGFTTYLSLEEVEMVEGYDILVYMYYLNHPDAIAQAGFPTNTGEAFNSIYINYDFEGELTNSERIFTATHEIGHSLGFRHTNWFDRNSDGFSDTSDPNDYEGITEVGANHIQFTPTGLDPNSVMNAIVAPWSFFSQDDMQSVRYLYPKFEIIHKEIIEYDYDIYHGTPILSFDTGVPKWPLPDPRDRYSWFYKENHKRDSKWVLMRGIRTSSGKLRLPRNYQGRITLVAVLNDKITMSSKEIRILR